MRWFIHTAVKNIGAVLTVVVNVNEKLVHRPTSDTRMTYKVGAQCPLIIVRVMMLEGLVHATTVPRGAATALCGDYAAHDFVWHRPTRYERVTCYSCEDKLHDAIEKHIAGYA